VPDELLHACTAIGRHDEIKPVIEARFAAVSDTLQASASAEHPSDLPPDLVQEIRALPTAFAGFAS
jgi:hypothetical protein